MRARTRLLLTGAVTLLAGCPGVVTNPWAQPTPADAGARIAVVSLLSPGVSFEYRAFTVFGNTAPRAVDRG